jgi:hypothetical protein
MTDSAQQLVAIVLKIADSNRAIGSDQQRRLAVDARGTRAQWRTRPQFRCIEHQAKPARRNCRRHSSAYEFSLCLELESLAEAPTGQNRRQLLARRNGLVRKFVVKNTY